MRLHLSTGLGGDNGAGGDGGAGAAILDLVDQRMPGGLHVVDLTPAADGAPGEMGDPRSLLPADAIHIARDLPGPVLELIGSAGVITRIRASRRVIKTQLSDQGLVSSIGNIYADKGLWKVRVHGLRPGTGLGPRVVTRILESTAEVMRRAPEVDDTSSDALYVNVESVVGFSARKLGTYGHQGLECRRCKATMVHGTLGGRSHTYCPRYQTCPRRRR